MSVRLFARDHGLHQVVALDEQIEAHCHHMAPDQQQDHIEDRAVHSGQPGRGVVTDQQRQGTAEMQAVIGKQARHGLGQKHQDKRYDHQPAGRIVAGIHPGAIAQIGQHSPRRVQKIAEPCRGGTDQAPADAKHQQRQQGKAGAQMHGHEALVDA